MTDGLPYMPHKRRVMSGTYDYGFRLGLGLERHDGCRHGVTGDKMLTGIRKTIQRYKMAAMLSEWARSPAYLAKSHIRLGKYRARIKRIYGVE